MIKNLDQLINLSKQKKGKKLAVAAAEDQYVLNAINKAHKEGYIVPILIGDKKKIISHCKQLEIEFDLESIVDIPNPENACIHAVKMVNNGDADFLMKGLVATGTLLKQVISKEYGLAKDRILSHLAIFETPNYHKLFGLTDAAMNISPNLEAKASILENAIECFHQLGVSIPKAAILSASEKVNPKIIATTDAIELKNMAKNGRFKNAEIDGPFALDNAISKEAANHKGITSKVAGDADILLAPDLNSGNILYKSLSFLAKARCAAIIVGSTIPIVLTSRADTEETKYLSILLGVALTN